MSQGKPASSGALTVVIIMVGLIMTTILAVVVCGLGGWFFSSGTMVTTSTMTAPVTMELITEDELNTDIARVQLDLMQQQVQMFFLDVGGYPTTEQGLNALRERPDDLSNPDVWNGPYAGEAIPLDPWDRQYGYQLLDESRFRIWSWGPDGNDGSADDIVVTP